MTVNSSQVAPAEGADGGRCSVVVRYVVAEDGICTRIPAGPLTNWDWLRLEERRPIPPRLVAAEALQKEDWLLSGRLRAGAFCRVGVNGAGHAWIDKPLKPRRMAVEVQLGDGAFPHADGRSAIGGDQTP